MDAREDYNNWRKAEEQKLYNEVINNPSLTQEQLWSLSADTFNEWRKKHDYPKLISAFNTVPSFVQWKKEFDLKDEWIYDFKVSAFIAHKKLSKNKNLYFLEQTFDGIKRNIVTYADLSKEKNLQFPDRDSYQLIKKFVSYYDWCLSKKVEPGIFNINQRQAPSHQAERVWLSCGYELLKMGGISAPVNGFGLLYRGKHLEFVNLCGLTLEGEIHYGDLGNLELSFCAVDHLKCLNLKMYNLDIEYSTLSDLKLENSEISCWRFWQCQTAGNCINSKLDRVQIFGGNFTPFYKDSFLIQVEANHKFPFHSNYETTYSSLKKLYSDQGNDELAKKYYLRERELIREYSKGLRYFLMSISYYYWGYGKKPANVIYYSVGMIVICALTYFMFNESLTPVTTSLVDCFYYSTVTFTTLGYGDILPKDGLRIVALFEAFFGALNIGFLVAGFSNSKY